MDARGHFLASRRTAAGNPCTACSICRASLVFVVLQASGVAAPAGAASAAPSITASTLDWSHDLP
jgi:hypothetical protein